MVLHRVRTKLEQSRGRGIRPRGEAGKMDERSLHIIPIGGAAWQVELQASSTLAEDESSTPRQPAWKAGVLPTELLCGRSEADVGPYFFARLTATASRMRSCKADSLRSSP